MEEEKQKEQTIFSADFSVHKKEELLHLLDDWIDDIQNLRQMKIMATEVIQRDCLEKNKIYNEDCLEFMKKLIGLRMLIRIIQSKL